MDPTPHSLVTGDLFDEFCNKLKHLYRSQDELFVYLTEQPEGDGIIEESISENDANIRIMCHKIELLKADLPETDSRKHLDLCELQRTVSTSTPATAPEISENQSTSAHPATSLQTDSGVYL